MNKDDAIAAAETWIAIRLQVRELLIEAAKEANPKPFDSDKREWKSNTLRKLFQYPNDLSERRLLDLIRQGDKCHT